MFCFCATTAWTYIRLRRLFATAFCSAFLTMGAVGAQAYQVNGVNAPLGVFAHIDLEQAINSYVQTTGCSVLPGGVSKASVRQSLGALYDDLLSDQAISGLVGGVGTGTPDTITCNSTIGGEQETGNQKTGAAKIMNWVTKGMI